MQQRDCQPKLASHSARNWREPSLPPAHAMDGSRMPGLSVSRARGLQVKSPICTCDFKTSCPFTFEFSLGNVKFRFEQERPRTHSRGCVYYGINKKGALALKTQFPLRMGWLSTRMTLACIDFTNGAGSLGASIRYRNIVLDCPVFEELEDLKYWIVDANPSETEIIGKLESTKRTVLSLYSEGKSSPSNRTVDDSNHVKVGTFAVILYSIPC